MKFSAAILLIVFAVFTSEKMVLPANCMSNQKVSKCMMCSKAKNMKGTCGGMKNKSGKKESATPQCLDCPLCVIMVHQPINHFQANAFTVKREYNIAASESLSDYFHQQWKPPNAPSFFRLT
ncbi:MAG TPA: hypothetical protein VKT28_22385 [Puia sp.]|nr:hypothetical protein [Puia sp.]